MPASTTEKKPKQKQKPLKQKPVAAEILKIEPPTTEDAPPSETPAKQSWQSLKPQLSPWVLGAVDSMGFSKMTPVQASTIPLFMGNKDVVVEAVTGSGKTLSFLIPIVERLLRGEPKKKNHVGAIVISPTRELATQIHSVLKSLLAFHAPSASKEGAEADPSATRITPLLLLGGTTPPAQDLKNFLQQSPNFLIGTPGRLNELLASQHVLCTTDSFEALVLDEADRLLDLGFKETLTKIISRLPKQRRTGLFSASVSDAIVGSLVRTGLRNPVKIAVKVHTAKKEKRTPASLAMTYILATPRQRLVHLQRILSPVSGLFPVTNLPQKTIIYLSNCVSVDYFASLFPAILPGPKSKSGGYTIVPLHGKQSPKIRQTNFAQFTSSTSPSILLTTDLAARGLDIPEVDLVVQIDPPTDPKVFLHRCGRAGRAGRKGLAVIFLSRGREEGYIDFLEVRKTPVVPLVLIQDSYDAENPTEEETAQVVQKLRAVVLRDRALHEKGMKAFVSHVRAHSKHQTASIFRVKDIEWKDLAEAFALLRMPKMPELRAEGVEKVVLGVEVNMSTFAYRDKVKEKARLEALAVAAETGAPEYSKVHQNDKDKKRKRTEAWSEKTDAADVREARREKRGKKREAERQNKMAPEEKQKEAEWKELVEEVKRRRKESEKGDAEFEGLE
ncbi:DEAD-domain-containing protein [Morchella conica CCBAS932]|uniref:ATP-dependent RNA helicase n=1 Tax=Morchella conica CCBAS932 TaxID=1392247 RepID=A0A3N4KWE1_9PEZI|nr:DEAD-domain-containing protein [Morchella conica CCBAS932]